MYDQEHQKCSKAEYAGLRRLRAQRIGAQLDFFGVLELWRSESALPVLF
jgi:hypothetical protein